MTNEELQTIENLLKSNLQPIREELQEIKDQQRKLEVTVENEIDRSIKTLAEGHMVINRKLDANLNLQEDVETLQHKVAAIEHAIKKAQ